MKLATLRQGVWASALGVGVALIAGCQSPEPFASKIGQDCTVQIRRDLLGGTSSTPVPPDTDSMNGAEVQVSGKLTQVTKDYLVLEQSAPANAPRTYVVPRSSILLVRFVNPPATPP